MTSLLEKMERKKVSADRAAAAERVKATAEYADVLARSHRPKRGDEKRLIRLCGILALDDADVANDIRAAKRLSDLESQMPDSSSDATVGKKVANLMKSRREIEAKLQQQIDSIDEEVRRLEGLRTARTFQRSEIGNAIRMIKERNPRIMGLLLDAPDSMSAPPAGPQQIHRGLMAPGVRILSHG